MTNPNALQWFKRRRVGAGFSPLADPDLIGLWMPALGDASDNGSVLTIANRKVGNAAIVSASGPGRAVIDPTGLNGLPCVDSTGMTLQLSAAIGPQIAGASQVTLIFLIMHDSLAASSLFQLAVTSATLFAYYNIAGARRFQLHKQGTSSVVNQRERNAGLVYPRPVTFRSDTSQTPHLSSVRQDGGASDAAFSGVDAVNTISNGPLHVCTHSGAVSSPFDGKLGGLAVIKRRLTDTEVTQWETWMNAQARQAGRKLVGWTGDSISACSIVGGAQWTKRVDDQYAIEAAADLSYWLQYTGQYSTASTAFAHNFANAAGGSTIATLLADLTTYLYGQRFTPDIMPILIGTNDIAAGRTPAQVAADLVSYVAAAKALLPNCLFVVQKLLSRAEVGFNANITTLNTLLPQVVADCVAAGARCIYDTTLRDLQDLGSITLLDAVHPDAASGNAMGDAMLARLKVWRGL